MSAVAVFGLGHCSTCKKAVAWLNEHGIGHRFVDYREQPIPAQDLKVYAAQLGWEKLVNRASQTWRGLPEAQKSPQDEGDWLALVQAHPTLIRRPLLVLPHGRAIAGFDTTQYTAAFGSGVENLARGIMKPTLGHQGGVGT
jgi:Spx/MgsR family transcriptional regulator